MHEKHTYWRCFVLLFGPRYFESTSSPTILKIANVDKFIARVDAACIMNWCFLNTNLINAMIFLLMMQVFIFSLRKENAPVYDWSRVTTIVEFGYLNDTVTCLAHSMNARALSNGKIYFYWHWYCTYFHSFKFNIHISSMNMLD